MFLDWLSTVDSMILFETMILSTMVHNDLVMPIPLRADPHWPGWWADLICLAPLLWIRCVGIAATILLGYLRFRFVGESYALVASSLISLAAAAHNSPH